MTREDAFAAAKAAATETLEPQGLCYDGSEWAFASLRRLRSIQLQDSEEWVYPGIALKELNGYVREVRFTERVEESGPVFVYCATVNAEHTEEAVFLVELFTEHPLWGRSHVRCGHRHTKMLKDLERAPLEDVFRMETRLSASTIKEVRESFE